MPPVSSRTTSRSVPSMRSRRRGEDPYSAGAGFTGRRFAYSPSPWRSPSRPCSGRGRAGSVASHLRPATAARSTAPAARHAASTWSVSAVPWRSIEAPPKGCSSSSKSPSAPSSSSAGAMISGPMPSPGNVTMRRALIAGRRPSRSQRRGDRPGALALGFVGVDLRLRAEGHADVVEALQQAPADLGIDLEGDRHELAVGTRIAHLAGAQIDLPFPDLRQRPALLVGKHHRQQPDLRAVGVEDVGEARRDDRLEAVVLKAPGGVLARGAAAEVLAGDEDRVRRQLPIGGLGPVVEQELSETA